MAFKSGSLARSGLLIAATVAATLGVQAAVAQVRQPYMENALAALGNAKQFLVDALADKGGHRDNAINLVDQAIAEVQAGIDYAE